MQLITQTVRRERERERERVSVKGGDVNGSLAYLCFPFIHNHYFEVAVPALPTKEMATLQALHCLYTRTITQVYINTLGNTEVSMQVAWQKQNFSLTGQST